MWFNPFMRWLVASPLHFLVSQSVMLMTYHGSKSGQSYTVPMNYLAVEDTLCTISTRDRVWWRNLRSGADVRLRLRGKDVPASARAILDVDQVADDLRLMVATAPHMAKYLGIKIDPTGAPDPEDIARQALLKVIVRSRLK